jgi:hypothetical protein
MNFATSSLRPIALLKRGYRTFRRRPGFSIAAWIIYAWAGSFNGGTYLESGDAREMDGFETVFAAGGPWYALILVVIAGAIRGGYDHAMLRLLRGDDGVKLSDIFAGFHRYGQLLSVHLLYGAIVFLGILLCVLPGIYMAIVLFPAFLIAMESDKSPLECIKRSYTLATPHFVPLFLLLMLSTALTFVGLLAFYVGVLVTGPVIQLAWLAAYDEITTREEPRDDGMRGSSKGFIHVGGRVIENKPLRPS